MKSEWTIVTVTHNSANDLREYSVTYDLDGPKWIVVDNNSQDDTLAVSAKKGVFKSIALKANLGFSKANNVALAEVTTKYVAFVNPDVTVDFSSLDELDLGVFDNFSIAAPQLLYRDGRKQPNGRSFPFLAYKIANRIGQLKRLRDRYQIYASSDQRLAVAWVTGAVVMGKTETFRKIGGWPEKYFLYYEDTELCLKIRKIGGSITLLGDHNWIHGWKRETSKLKLKPWARELSSMLKFYWAHKRFLGLPSNAAISRAKDIYGGE